MENILVELGMGGLVALLITREVLGFIKSNKTDNKFEKALDPVIKHQTDLININDKMLEKITIMCTQMDELINIGRRGGFK